MADGPTYRVKFRRRREGKTDYRKRLALLKSGKIRAVVRKTGGRIIVQFVEYRPEGDRVIASATSTELRNYGWELPHRNTPGAYLTGYLAALRARKAGVEEAVLDIGRHVPVRGGRIFSALKGIVDGGVDVPHSEEIFPSEERIKGTHISENHPALFDEVKKKMEESP